MLSVVTCLRKWMILFSFFSFGKEIFEQKIIKKDAWDYGLWF